MRLRPGSYLILGMLDRGIRTGYAIKRTVDRSTRFFWAASLAQVYPELAALEADGYVTGTDEPHGNRPRRTYALTEKGRTALGDWLRSERVPDFEQRDEGLLQLFFADALPEAEALALVRRMRARAEQVARTSRPRSCRSRNGPAAASSSSSPGRALTTSRGARSGSARSRPSSIALRADPLDRGAAAATRSARRAPPVVTS